MLLDIEDHEIFFDKLRFTFLQMPAFGKKEDELKNHYDKWCFFLQNLEIFDNIPEILKEEIFEKAFKTAEIANLTIDEYKKYIDSLDAYREIKGVTETAKEEGRNEKAMEMAKKMIIANKPVDEIIDFTELANETVEKLINEMKIKP